MANVDRPEGLRPLARTAGGGRPEVNPYTKAVGYNAAIFRWDPVTLLAGVLNGPASGITPGTTRYLGVALHHSPAATAAEMLVMDSPDALFECQADEDDFVAAVVGYNANLLLTAGGSPLPDQSRVEVNSDGINTTSSLDVHCRRLSPGIANEYGEFARIEVVFNKHLKNKEVTVT